MRLPSKFIISSISFLIDGVMKSSNADFMSWTRLTAYLLGPGTILMTITVHYPVVQVWRRTVITFHFCKVVCVLVVESQQEVNTEGLILSEEDVSWSLSSSTSSSTSQTYSPLCHFHDQRDVATPHWQKTFPEKSFSVEREHTEHQEKWFRRLQCELL